jgi:hypothetical protein
VVDTLDRRWASFAYAYGIVAALGVAYFLVKMPYQVGDGLGHILIVQQATIKGLFVSQLTGTGYLRPLWWVQQKLLFDLANGHYFAAFKAFHVAQLVLLLVLFIRLLRVRSLSDVVAAPLAVAVLLGIHTFNITIREAYPINHYLTMLWCCLLAVHLMLSRGGWWADLAAVLIFPYALLTLESGILVWVCLVAGYALGWRGVSRRAILAATALLAVYGYMRLGPLNVGLPALTERSSGFGFSVRSTGELVRMFGASPWIFYAYNVVCSVLTVLFSEPRAGVWTFTNDLREGGVPPWQMINICASLIATIIVADFAVRRVRKLRARGLEYEDQLLVLFLVILGANAAVSYPYTKDVLMSPAGMFYAAVVFVATRDLLNRLSRSTSTLLTSALVGLALLVMSTTWTMRAAGLAQTLRASASVNRNDWAVSDEWLDRQKPDWRTGHPQAEQLAEQLRAEVIRMPVPQLFFSPRWMNRVFDPY